MHRIVAIRLKCLQGKTGTIILHDQHGLPSSHLYCHYYDCRLDMAMHVRESFLCNSKEGFLDMRWQWNDPLDHHEINFDERGFAQILYQRVKHAYQTPLL